MPKEKPVKITLKWDEENSMEQLVVNGKELCTGNEWDYHCDDRLDAMKDILTLLNIPFTTETKKWKWKG